MIKATVLYGHPTDREDGSAPAYYRMAELHFNTPEAMQQSLGSPEGQVMVADLPNFTTGGVTIMVGIVEN